MALKGGQTPMTPSQMERFDPGVFDELAEKLDPNREVGQPLDDRKYRGLHAIFEFSQQNPGAYMLVLNYLAELSRGYADKCASVNPEQDPVKTHGRTCFNAGAAWAYAEAASTLHPKRIAQKLAAIRSEQTAVFSLDRDGQLE
jgi:hypothetical protein